MEDKVAARTREVEENNAELWFHNDELEAISAEIRERAAAEQAAQLEVPFTPHVHHEYVEEEA